MDIQNRKCLTPKGRVSFPNVFEARAFEGQEAKYSLTLLFPKNVDLSAMKKAANNAIVEKWGKDKTKWPKNLKNPFLDGDEKSDIEGYEGTIFVRASSKQRPGIVDQKCQPLTKEDDAFYPGCFARATLIAFAYDKAGNKGVSFALQNIQKLGDGERLGGRISAQDDFGEAENEEKTNDNSEF